MAEEAIITQPEGDANAVMEPPTPPGESTEAGKNSEQITSSDAKTAESNSDNLPATGSFTR